LPQVLVTDHEVRLVPPACSSSSVSESTRGPVTGVILRPRLPTRCGSQGWRDLRPHEAHATAAQSPPHGRRQYPPRTAGLDYKNYILSLMFYKRLQTKALHASEPTTVDARLARMPESFAHANHPDSPAPVLGSAGKWP
jgi:hypothetical protein